MRHWCNSVSSSFPSGARKFLFELQQLLPKPVDTAPSAAATATLAVQSTSLTSPAKTKSAVPVLGSVHPVSSPVSATAPSHILSPLTPSSSSRPLASAAVDVSESHLSCDIGGGGASDFEGLGSYSAASSPSSAAVFHADFFSSTRQGEKLVRIFARESERLSMVPPPTRTAELRRSLMALSQRIPSNLYIPIFTHLYSRWRLVGIAVDQYASP